jgi:hypothetical protein
MRRSIISLGASALLFLSVAAHAGDLALDKVPAAVRDAAQVRFADAKVIGAALGKADDGKDIYEISLEAKAKTRLKATFTPEGALILIETWIAREELPEPVAKTLERKYPKARYVRVKQVIEVVAKEEKLASYEAVLVTPKKQIWGVDLAIDGKIIKTEKKATEDDD